MSKNEIGLREARAQLGDLVNRAEYGGEVITITRHGRPAASLVPATPEQTMTPVQIAAQIKSLYANLKTAVDKDKDCDVQAVLGHLADAQFDASDAVRQIMRRATGDAADHAQSAALDLTNAGSSLQTAADHATA